MEYVFVYMRGVAEINSIASYIRVQLLIYSTFMINSCPESCGSLHDTCGAEIKNFI